MPYDHVTSLPFLLDSSYLTPEEIVEREANPALFAARRYGQPEHIFRTAAERHGNGSLRSTLPSFTAAHPHSSSALPRPSQASSTVTVSAGICDDGSSQSQQPSRSPVATPHLSHSPYSSGASSPRGSTTPGNYFSTVLSSAASECSASSPTPSSSAHTEADRAQHSGQEAQSHMMPARCKKKGKIHA
ncbi:hypothetical protein B5807_04556 [Epicoccum nigrum]|uniref:Uncharacterized protein n=1 Tax=Epicoccum nigrum TaxID=105696 RepID=A0A1Y2M475_EPING|nr:hypothetical protein B5807_04556 [Epicoccum nigrum]